MKGKLLYLLAIVIMLTSGLFLTSPTFRSSKADFATPTLYIDPQTTIAEVDETFSINVSVAEVTDLYGWEFKLYYLNDILNATEVTEGPFLKAGGNTYFTGGPSETEGILNDYNTTHGRIHIWCTLLEEIPGVNGTGPLATITFKATKTGTSNLALSKTFLINSKVIEIPHETIDGDFSATVHDVAIKDVTPSKTVVGQGYSLSISVSVKNYGSFAETFNIAAYYNETNIIATQDVVLANGNSTTVTLTWNTTGVTKGNYTISAYATPVPDETDIADNTYIDGFVVVAMVGDVNADGEVDILDVASVAKAYGSYPGHQTWNPNYDLNHDGQIDILDIAITAKNYGKLDS